MGSAASGGAGAGAGASGTAGVLGLDAGAGGAVAAEPSKYEACFAYMRAVCNRRYLTCLGAPPVDNPCPEQVESICPDGFFAPGTTVTVDDLMECARVRETGPCEEALRFIYPKCLPPGTFEVGTPCWSNLQCKSSRCGPADGGTCWGVCKEEAPLDGACSEEVLCPLSQDCANGTCVYRFSAEQGLAEGVECELYSQQCLYGLRCYPDPSDGVNRCLPPAPLGASCSGVCEKDAWCSGSGFCVSEPTEGQPCRLVLESGGFCHSGFYCDMALSPPTCVPQKARGEACSPTGHDLGASQVPSQCEEPWICDCRDQEGCTGHCVALRWLGEDCSEAFSECSRGTECDGSVCVGVESQGLFEQTCN